MSQLQHKDYTSQNPATSYMTSSRPALRDTTSSFATYQSENTTNSNMTNMTDPRAIRETERRFLNDTPAVAPYRSASEGSHRPLLPGSQPARLTHVDVRVPSNYHGGSATSTGSMNYMGAGIDRHLSNGGAVIPRHVSSAMNSDRHGGGLVTGSYHHNNHGSNSSSGEHRLGRGTYPESVTSSQGALTSSNTTFTIPSSSKATIRSLKSQLQKDKGRSTISEFCFILQYIQTYV